MNETLSQSSCEIITDIKNLEVCSETENVSSQCSEIAGKIEKLEVQSQEENTQQESSSSESSSKPSDESSSSQTTAKSSISESDEPQKRKRKRKRYRKKKITTAYVPPRPFSARYKKFKISEPAVLPKLHIRFDDDTCEPDQLTSEYNLKPRIISALKKNLSLLDNLKEVAQEKENLPLDNLQPDVKSLNTESLVISLKPRIIKAIIIH